MKKKIAYFCIIAVVGIASSSCSGCVKSASKKVTELGISAVEGVAEAVDEHGERIAEKTTDAAGKVAVGVGRSLEKGLEEHATHIFTVAGRTTVQAIDGLSTGLEQELATYYDVLPHTENFASGVSLNYIAKYKKKPVVDAYFIISDSGIYNSTFDCESAEGKILLTKKIEINYNGNNQQHQYTRVSFALNTDEEQIFNNITNIKITITKQK